MFEHLLQLLIANGAVEKGQVIAHRRLEELHILGDHGDSSTQIIEPQIPQVHPAQPDRAQVWIVQAEEQPGEGGFPRPGAPQDSQHSSRLDLKTDLGQSFALIRLRFFINAIAILFIIVLERNFVKSDRQRRRPAGLFALYPLADRPPAVAG